MITFFTVTGRQLDLECPRPHDVCLEDVATGLSHLCRYTGQLDRFYSVAQHARLVASLVDPSLAFGALNHDNSEAYLGDVSRHLKHAYFMEGYRDLEAEWTAAIESAFRLFFMTAEQRHWIKVADDLAAVFERVMLRHHAAWHPASTIEKALNENWVSSSRADDMMSLTPRLPAGLPSLTPSVAKVLFIQDFHAMAKQWQW